MEQAATERPPRSAQKYNHLIFCDLGSIAYKVQLAQAESPTSDKRAAHRVSF